MRAKITYFALAAVLIVYFILVGSRGVLLIREGTAITVPFGAAVLVLPFIGGWFLWQTTKFARDANRLARQLEAEDGLPVDNLSRTPSGRVDRDSADAVFRERQAQTEKAPHDWRSWFRLAIAYHDARDTPRARKAMQHAIAIHRAERRGAQGAVGEADAGAGGGGAGGPRSTGQA